MTEAAPRASPGRDAALRVTLALALLASAGSLLPVVSGAGWLAEVTAMLVVLTTLSVVLGWLGAPAVLLGLGQLVALALVLTVVHVPAYAALGVVPGPAAAARAAELLADALRVVDQQSAPVDATAGVRLALTGCGGLALAAMDALALRARRPALTGVLLLAVHGLGAVFAPDGLGPLAFTAAGGGYLAVLLLARRAGPAWGPVITARADARRWYPGPAPLAAAAALALALTVPVLAPLPSTGVDVGAGGRGGGATSVNPLLDLREALTERSSTTVLRYESDQPDPQPLRLVTVDSFDGDLWEPSEAPDAQPLPESGQLALPDGLDPEVAPTTAHRQRITVETLRQRYLPLPYPVRSVEVGGLWSLDPTTGTVTGAGGTRTEPGQTYDVDYLQVSPEPAALQGAPPPPAGLTERYTRLPEALPPEIGERAAALTEGSSTDYERAAALQTWFRSEGGFEYTTDPPAPQSPSALADFLTEQRGYCVHFASAMAVMARTLGIPARVGVGFLPGRSTPDGWEVAGSDAHAWPELWFAGVGWTRFEPTPATQTGSPPGWTVPAAEPAETSPGELERDRPTPSSPGAAEPPPTDDPGGSAEEEAPGPGGSRVAERVALLLGGVALVALLAAAPALARSTRSARRWSLARRGGDGALAEAAWADLVERSGDLGVKISASDTPRRAGRLVLAGVERGEAGADVPDADDQEDAPRPEGSRARVSRLVGALEATRYGSTGHGGGGDQARGGGVDLSRDPAVLRQDALEVVGALRTTVGAPRRLHERWWPRSGLTALAAPWRARS